MSKFHCSGSLVYYFQMFLIKFCILNTQITVTFKFAFYFDIGTITRILSHLTKQLNQIFSNLYFREQIYSN